MKKLYAAFLVLFVSLWGLGTAGAYTLTASDIAAGGTAGFATATSGPGAFKLKTVAGVTGVGVAGGFVDGEIDLAREFIKIDFAAPTVVSEIIIGFLFKVGNYGDTVSEVARVTNDVSSGDLSVTGNTTANWSAMGTVTNLSPGTNSNAGAWQITDPFGDAAVDYLLFTAVQVGASAGSWDSDYSIVSVSGKAVPEPATLLLLGAGLVGVIVTRKRKLI